MHPSYSPITRLVSILHRRAHTYLDRQLRPYGLSFTHFRMLVFLSYHPGMCQEDVRSFIDADKGGVAHSIKKLVEKGYVARKRDPRDRRAYVIKVTDEGSAFLAEVEHVASDFNDRMMEGLSADEMKLAEGLIQKMVDNVCELPDDDCRGCRCKNFNDKESD